MPLSASWQVPAGWWKSTTRLRTDPTLQVAFVFIPSIIVVIGILSAIAPPTSLAFLLINGFGFFGCGINIAGGLLAVMYTNAFDIDIFVRRTLVYLLLTASLFHDWGKCANFLGRKL